MKITKSKLKELIKSTIQEESEYQVFFKKVLDKFGFDSPVDMDDETKKKFFNVIDKGWSTKNEYHQKGDIPVEDEFKVFGKSYPKRAVSESINSDAQGIARFSGTRADAVEKFINTHNLDSKKLFDYIRKGTLKDRMDFATALSGKPNNKFQKKIVTQFSESLTEADRTKMRKLKKLKHQKDKLKTKTDNQKFKDQMKAVLKGMEFNDDDRAQDWYDADFFEQNVNEKIEDYSRGDAMDDIIDQINWSSSYMIESINEVSAMSFDEFKKKKPDVFSPYVSERDAVYKPKYDKYSSRIRYFKHGRKNSKSIDIKTAYDSYVYNIKRGRPLPESVNEERSFLKKEPKEGNYWIVSNQLLRKGAVETYYYISDAEGKVYHHKDNKWRKKTLMDISTYWFISEKSAREYIKRNLK